MIAVWISHVAKDKYIYMIHICNIFTWEAKHGLILTQIQYWICAGYNDISVVSYPLFSCLCGALLRLSDCFYEIREKPLGQKDCVQKGWIPFPSLCAPSSHINTNLLCVGWKQSRSREDTVARVTSLCDCIYSLNLFSLKVPFNTK